MPVRATAAPLEEIARHITIPVLLQWGENDVVVDISGAGPLREAFVDIEVQTQAGTGHLPMLEAPGPWWRLFGEFHRRRFGEPGHPP